MLATRTPLGLHFVFWLNVIIKFSDTGIGIEEKNLERIFEPFFTTKEPEKGTGLGLAVSNTIISRHKGSIKVESEVGKGTTFSVIVPLRRGSA